MEGSLTRFHSGRRRVWRWLHGPSPTRQDYRLVRWVFLRLLGLVHFVAFLSLSTQIGGLVGGEGILPAGEWMHALRQHHGGAAWWQAPTLGWWAASDFALKTYCYSGMIGAALLAAGVLPRLAVGLCWVLYLSLYHLGGVFLGFQWDILLLETTLLAWFLAPAVWLERPLHDPPVPRIALWTLRLLLWKLMFFSGWVKLPDETWTGLEALRFHFETQPLPHAAAWYAHHLPAVMLQFSVAAMFFIELVAPWFLFLPRRVRALGAASFALLMLLIMATGNYTFFNLLTLALCVLWLDDALLASLLPRTLRQYLQREQAPPLPTRSWRYPRVLAAGAWTFLLGLQTIALFGGMESLGSMRGALAAVQPWCVCNSYGLFRFMTTERHEIEIEGSNDRINWKPYRFHYKPGDPSATPRWCQPHQPRLDWQMWFAALSQVEQTPWFQRLVLQLLRGSKPVESLFAEAPFKENPPAHIRALYYRYRFTSWEEGFREGTWWKRELRGEYLVPVSLRQP